MPSTASPSPPLSASIPPHGTRSRCSMADPSSMGSVSGSGARPEPMIGASTRSALCQRLPLSGRHCSRRPLADVGRRAVRCARWAVRSSGDGYIDRCRRTGGGPERCRGRSAIAGCDLRSRLASRLWTVLVLIGLSEFDGRTSSVGEVRPFVGVLDRSVVRRLRGHGSIVLGTGNSSLASS